MGAPPRIHGKRSVHDSRFLRVEEVDLEFSNGELSWGQVFGEPQHKAA